MIYSTKPNHLRQPADRRTSNTTRSIRYPKDKNKPMSNLCGHQEPS